MRIEEDCPLNGVSPEIRQGISLLCLPVAFPGEVNERLCTGIGFKSCIVLPSPSTWAGLKSPGFDYLN